MNGDLFDIERELTEHLQDLAPRPRPGDLDRALGRVATTSQRALWNAGLTRVMRAASPLRLVSISAVVVAAVILSVSIGQLHLPGIGPAASDAQTSAPSASGSPSDRASDAASPTDTVEEPMARSTEDLGIRLTAALDRGRTTFGERVWADVTVDNLGPDSVWWLYHGECRWLVEVTVRPDVATPIDAGRDDWPGDFGIFKDGLIADEQPPSLIPDRRRAFISEERVESGSLSCFAVLGMAELAEGDSATHRAAWDTDDFKGMPPAPGRYTVEVTFGFWRGTEPDLPPNAEPQTVALQIPLVVGGPDEDWISPGLAIDALLVDARLLAVLEEHPRELWRGGEIAFEDGTWIATYWFANGEADEEPSARLVGVVDARTGQVDDVRLENAPPD